MILKMLIKPLVKFGILAIIVLYLDMQYQLGISQMITDTIGNAFLPEWFPKI